MSRWLLVELEPDLVAHHTSRTGVFVTITLVNGVKQVTDISSMSRRTIDEWVGEWFLPEEQTLVSKSAARRPRRNGVD
jgi:hypothetical protein